MREKSFGKKYLPVKLYDASEGTIPRRQPLDRNSVMNTKLKTKSKSQILFQKTLNPCSHVIFLIILKASRTWFLFCRSFSSYLPSAFANYLGSTVLSYCVFPISRPNLYAIITPRQIPIVHEKSWCNFKLFEVVSICTGSRLYIQCVQVVQKQPTLSGFAIGKADTCKWSE